MRRNVGRDFREDRRCNNQIQYSFLSNDRSLTKNKICLRRQACHWQPSCDDILTRSLSSPIFLFLYVCFLHTYIGVNTRTNFFFRGVSKMYTSQKLRVQIDFPYINFAPRYLIPSPVKYLLRVNCIFYYLNGFIWLSIIKQTDCEKKGNVTLLILRYSVVTSYFIVNINLCYT